MEDLGGGFLLHPGRTYTGSVQPGDTIVVFLSNRPSTIVNDASNGHVVGDLAGASGALACATGALGWRRRRAAIARIRLIPRHQSNSEFLLVSATHADTLCTPICDRARHQAKLKTVTHAAQRPGGQRRVG